MRVLVTYGWCRTAYVAVRSLARLGHHVFTCSHHQPSMSAWSRFARSSAAVADPFSEPELFAGDVARLVKRFSIDVVLPCHEDALALRRFEHTLPDGVVLACPERELLELAVDKARVTKLAIEVGVPTPETRFPRTVEEAIALAEEIEFPVIAKLRRSNSGKGVAAARTVDELAEILRGRFASFVEDEDRFPVLQALLPGQVVGACFLAHKGVVVAVFGERYLRCKESSFGTSVFRERLAWPRLTEHVEKIVQRLRWTGLGHFDFIEEPEGNEAFLLELNPRLWGAINLAYINGYDFPGALVAQACEDHKLDRFFSPKHTFDLTSIWLVGEMIAGVNRWQAGELLGPLREAASLIRSLPRSRFDDLLWHDPLAFIAESLCYAKQFVRYGGSTNPPLEGMME